MPRARQPKPRSACVSARTRTRAGGPCYPMKTSSITAGRVMSAVEARRPDWLTRRQWPVRSPATRCTSPQSRARGRRPTRESSRAGCPSPNPGVSSSARSLDSGQPGCRDSSRRDERNLSPLAGSARESLSSVRFAGCGTRPGVPAWVLDARVFDDPRGCETVRVTHASVGRTSRRTRRACRSHQSACRPRDVGPRSAARRRARAVPGGARARVVGSGVMAEPGPQKTTGRSIIGTG